MKRMLPVVLLVILAVVRVCPLSSQQQVPSFSVSDCKRPHVQAFTSVSLPRVEKLLPLSRLARKYDLVLVVESPSYLQKRLFGSLTLGAFDSTMAGFGGPVLKGQAGFKLELDQLHLSMDSVPHASLDSSLFAATTLVNQRRETMQIALGQLELPLVVLFVTSAKNAITGLWVSQGGNDPEAERGFFCASPR